MTGNSLSAVNTLGVPSRADHVVVARSANELAELAAEAQRRRLPWTVLGGGSNVVLGARVPGVVCLVRLRGRKVEPVRGGARITAAAGEGWHDLVRFSLGQGFSGLENLALIPGSVGAAPVQNVGAYGVELADRLVCLRALDPRTGKILQLDRDDCGFGYRESRFKTAEAAHLVIVDVTLELRRGGSPVVEYPDLALELERLGRARPSPAQVAEAVIRVRRRKLPDPRRVGNAGSFFKNPELEPAAAQALCRRYPELVHREGTGGRIKVSAAQLIDLCGWKGRQVGPVAVWHRQPLVLVNRGGATGRDVLAVSEDIRRDVESRFGVRLELEPRVLGQD